jgi:hypothetical protein
MRRHDDQIATPLCSGGDDAFSWMLIFHVDALTGYAMRSAALGSVVENVTGCGSRYFFEMTDRIAPALPCFMGNIEDRPWLGHRDDCDPGFFSLRKREAMIKGLGRQFRTIGGNQDVLVH